MIMESVGDREINRLLLIARCHRHAILWHDHQRTNKDKMTEKRRPRLEKRVNSNKHFFGARQQ